MKKIRTNNGYFEEYGSVLEFVNTIEQAPDNGCFSIKASQLTGCGAEAFTASKSWEEAQELLRHGWVEGVANLTNAKTCIKSESESRIAPQYVNTVCGGCPIVPNAILGLPNSMRSRMKTPTAQRVISITFDCSMGSTESSRAIIEAGRKILQLVRAIEAGGVRVNLYATLMVADNSKDKKLFGCSVKVKDAAARINPALIAYPMIHPSFLRRHMLRWLETCDAVKGSTLGRSAYGCPITWDQDSNAEAQRIIESKGKIFKRGEYYIHMFNAAYMCKDIDDLKEAMGL